MAIVTHSAALKRDDIAIKSILDCPRLFKETTPSPIVLITFPPKRTAPRKLKKQVIIMPVFTLIMPDPMLAPTQFAASFAPIDQPM